MISKFNEGTMFLRVATISDLPELKTMYKKIVDINKPAINLYLKNNFKQVDGVYKQHIDANLILNEYGFEIKL